jgi:ABC-type sugar transport system permease subunit
MSLWSFRRQSHRDRPPRPEENQESAIAAWLFLAPALLLLGIFVLGPIVYLIYLSFTAGSFTRTGTHWIGFSNYWRLFLNQIFGKC